MECGDIIQLVLLVITAAALFVTIRTNNKLLKLKFFSEYTKRYQEIMLHLPECVDNKEVDFDKLDTATKIQTIRYMRAYFDLCSEEYYLQKNKYVDKKIWKEWESGIEYLFAKPIFKNAGN